MHGMWLIVAGVAAMRAPLSVTRRTAFEGAAATAALSLARPAAAAGKPVDLGKLGIGAWAWGDSLFWGYDPKKDDELHEVFDFIAAKAGFLDTAEVYGFGRSETLIGGFAKGVPKVPPIATKFAALPWRTSASDVVKACEASLKRLDRDSIELYQVRTAGPTLTTVPGALP